MLVAELAPDEVIVATGAVPTRSGFSSVAPLVETLPGVEQDAIYDGYMAGLERWSPEERYIYEGELERWEEAMVPA